MKKIIAVLIMVLFAGCIYSQSYLNFCTGVDPNGGYCVLNNTKFISSPDSTSALIYMQIKNPKGIPSSKILYKTFSIDKKGEETYFHSFQQNIQNGWDASWQPDYFPSPGKYIVRVYDDLNKEMCNKSFELRRDW